MKFTDLDMITRFNFMPLEERIVLDAALVADVASGATNSDPAELTDVNGTLFFTADDGVNGRELWKTDGTTTSLVKDIYAGSLGSNPLELTNFNGTLFFVADDGVNGPELWKSDGTELGTVLVKNIYAGATGSSISDLTVSNNTLYFSADDGVNGSELWKSDGTDAGTILVSDISAGATGSNPYELTDVNGTLFFGAQGVNGIELWKSDGTAGGTVEVANIRKGGNDSSPTELTNVNGTLFFTADDGKGFELWVSDGTANGTVEIDINSTRNTGSNPANFVDVGGTLYFTADDGTNGAELWKSDGTANGTVMVKDITAGAGSSTLSEMTEMGGSLYFFTGTNELWTSDGTSGGTVSVKSFSSAPSGLTVYNGELYFAAEDGANGRELWKSDGTTGGTQELSDINSGSGSSSPQYFEVSGSDLYFTANDGTNGNEVWRYNPNAAPTVSNPIADVTVSEDASNTVIDLSSTFTDADLDTLTLSVTSNTNTSLVSTNLVGNTLTLTYLGNQNGAANITVRATDSAGGYIEDTFLVTVNAVNDNPTLQSLIADVTVSEDAPNTVLDLSSTFGDVDILTNGDSLTLTVVGNSNSSLVSTTISGNSLTLGYAAEQSGTGNITVRATDSSGAWVEDTFSVTVNALNDTPTVDNLIADVTVNEEAANTVLDLSSTFNDVDILTDGDSLTLSVAGNTNSTLLSATLLGNILTLDYAADENGTANITIRATDSSGAWVEDTFLVTVNAVNDSPTVDNLIADITVNEDAANTVLDLSSTFGDVDILTNGDSLTLSVVGNTNSSLVTASMVGNSLTLDYAAEQNGTASITIRATDSSGAWVEDTFLVTVSAVNDAPTVDNLIADVTVNEDAANTVLDLSSTFGDVDILTDGDSLTLSVVGNTNSSLVNATLVGNSLTLDYAADQNGTANITIRATDESGAWVEDTFLVTVNNVNDNPTVDNLIADVTVNEDAANTVLDLSSTFGDVDILTNSDSLTLSVTGNTNSGLVTTSLVDNSLTLAFVADQNGTASITIRATDSSGAFVEDTFLVTVNATDDVPIIDNAIPDVTVNEEAANTVIDLSNSFSDADVINGDSLTYTVQSNTNSGLVTTSLAGNNLTLAYVADQNGTANITVRATDTSGNFIEDTFLVTVNAVNDAPTVQNAIADISVNEDAPNTVLDLSNAFDDVDILTNADSLTLSVASNSNSSLVTASLVGNSLTLDYAENQNGVASITIRATDGSGAYVEDTFLVTVNAVNDTPTVDNIIADVTVNEDAANTVLDLSSTFNDVDILTNSDSITLSVSGNDNSSLVTASLTGNSLTLAYAADQNGTANITIRATDSSGAFVEDTFLVTVNPIADSPVVENVKLLPLKDAVTNDEFVFPETEMV